MIFLLLVICFFQSTVDCSGSPQTSNDKSKVYKIDDLIQKYQNNEPMTCEEIQFYIFHRGVRMQQQDSFSQFFWMGNFVAMNIIGPLVTKYFYPYINTILTKRAFKKKIKIKKNFINFSNIAGYESVKIILQPIIENIKNQKKLKKLEKIDGILFYGEPGCGKTYFVKALASQMDIPVVSIFMKDLIDESGLVTDKIDILFESLKEITDEGREPVILFLDEIDFLIANRNNEKIEQNIKLILQNFLDKLDGSEELKGICVIGCTNYKEKLDPAVLRSGRIGTLIEINKPIREDIIALITMYSKKFKIDLFDEKEIERLADSFIGLSVSDIIKEIKKMKK
jgi:SpoVK/Ycf46/Vps4 family AAA+-type ATPase